MKKYASVWISFEGDSEIFDAVLMGLDHTITSLWKQVSFLGDAQVDNWKDRDTKEVANDIDLKIAAIKSLIEARTRLDAEYTSILKENEIAESVENDPGE